MNVLFDGIYDALNVAGVTALVGTRIYRDAAPPNPTYPLVVLQHIAGGEDNQTPVRAASPLFQVRAVSDLSAAEAGSVAAAVDTALHGVTVTVSGYTNYWTARESLVVFSEYDPPSGKRFWHSGAQYRVRIAQ